MGETKREASNQAKAKAAESENKSYPSNVLGKYANNILAVCTNVDFKLMRPLSVYANKFKQQKDFKLNNKDPIIYINYHCQVLW